MTRFDEAGYWVGSDNPETADPFGYDSYPAHVTPLQLSIADEIEASLLSPVLVAGCGPGYLVAELRGRGVDAWGVDMSDWALANQAPGVSAYVFGASDLRNKGQARSVMRDVDPALVVSEDMLVCLSDFEAQTLGSFLREWASVSEVWHFVSTHEIGCRWRGGREGPIEICPYNTTGRSPDPVTGMVQLRTLAEWRTLLGPDSRIISHRGEAA